MMSGHDMLRLLGRVMTALLLSVVVTVGSQQSLRACAVATTLRVENRSGVLVRSLYVSKPSVGRNQLTKAGLPPGEAAKVTLPSCLGTYEISAEFADGRVVAYPDLDGRSIRGLVLR